jgi:hypothetical protein
MYITPNRFKTMGFGIDMSNHTELEIRSVINQASNLVNSYCAVPLLPNHHDFRGGTVVKEQHRWPLPALNFTSQTSRRVYALHQPIKEVTSFSVNFTNTYKVTVDPVNLYVNRIESWAEVVSIAAIISGVYPVGINFGLYTPIAEMDYTYGWEFPVVKEYLSPTDSTIVYQAANQFWLVGSTPQVYVNNALQTTGYTCNFNEGTVTFGTALNDADEVTVSYISTLPEAIAMATGHLTATFMAEADLIGKGMGNLSSIKVEEVELRRFAGHTTGTRAMVDSIDPAVGTYLSDFIYLTAR